MHEPEIRVPHLRGKLAAACLAGTTAVYLGHAWWAYKVKSMLSGLESGAVTPEEFLEELQWGDSLGNISLVAMVITAVVFVSWLYRCYDNAHKLMGDRSTGAGAAIFGWMIPIASWFIPYRVTMETWKAAAPQEGADTMSPRIVQIWWAGWIALSLFGFVVMSKGTPTTREGVDSLCTVVMLQGLIAAFTAAAGIMVVRAITARHAARASEPVAAARVVD